RVLFRSAIAAYHAEKNGTVVNRAGVGVSTVSSAPSKNVYTSRTPLYLQIGAFSSKPNAEALVGQVAANNATLGKGAQILSEAGVHRVLIGPFSSIDQANEAAIELTAFVQVQPIIKQDLILP
ncbi:SPOR domain-containing protein, partial [Limnobacter sp.]|uniref:SPOR domain-containing protein n=2 Tax=Limnobacter sp. TaxID=2003368 RepID=UPI00355A4AAD